LFAELAAAFIGRPRPAEPDLGHVAEVMLRHGELLAQLLGEDRGCRDFRKHVAWYLKGFSVRRELRVGLANVGSLAELAELLAQLDPRQPFPVEIARGPRGRTGSPKPVALPHGWLDSRTLDDESRSMVAAAEQWHSGG